MHKLNTKEDLYKLHKIIVIPCCAHFLYRMVRICCGFDTGLYPGSYVTLFWLLMHALLPLTSLIFRVTYKRNVVHTVIWKEYQLMAISFSFRSIIMCLLLWFGLPQNWYIVRLLFFLPFHFWADRIAQKYNDPEFGTQVRGASKLYEKRYEALNANPNGGYIESELIDKIGKMLASVGQIIGSFIILSGNIQDSWWVCLSIQIAPFCMTLVRKGLISNITNHIIYMSCIFIPMITIPWSILFISKILMIAILRFYFNMNKYILWSLVSIVLSLSNYYFDQEFNNSI